MEIAHREIQKNGHFLAALSGGQTPRPVHGRLAERPHESDDFWDFTHLFWVDERCVPETDPVSNWGAAQKDFLKQVPIPRAQLYPMPGTLPPEQGALQYEKTLERVFDLTRAEFPRFDLIFLGVGTDGHVASLFPGDKSLIEAKRRVIAVKGGNPNVRRLTMTLPVLNNAKHIVFLVSGTKKCDIIARLFKDGSWGLPAGRICPPAGQVTWILDKGAASGLDDSPLG